MKLIKKVFLIIMLISFNADSKWIEITGKSIIEDDPEDARDEAIKNAIKEASFQAGFDIEQRERIRNGILKESTFTIENKGQISSIDIIAEEINGNIYEVDIKLNISKDKLLCKNDIKSTAVILETEVKYRDQLRYGGLFDLKSAINKKIESSAEKIANFFFPTKNSKAHIFQEEISAEENIKLLAKKNNAQYVIASEVIDTSINYNKGILRFNFFKKPEREFKISFMLYHGISGEMLWHKDYHNKSIWNFAKNTQINAVSSQFWESEYGEMIEDTIEMVVKEIDDCIRCKVATGQIIAKKDDRIIINLGRRNLIKRKDRFRIIAIEKNKDRNDEIKLIPKATTAEIEINNTTEYYSTALLKKEKSSLNVQINDMVIKINEAD